MKNGTVYLAGKMAGLTYQEMIKWRIEATVKLKEYGFSVLDPTDTDLPKKNLTSRSVTDNNKYQIRHSDIVLAEFDYEEISLGTFGEIIYAKEKGLPVVAWGRAKVIKHPWIQEHITIHFEKLQDALEYIIENYYCYAPATGAAI